MDADKTKAQQAEARAFSRIKGAKASLFEPQSARAIACVCRPSSLDGIVIVREDKADEITKYRIEEIVPLPRVGAGHVARIQFQDGTLLEIKDGELFEFLLEDAKVKLPEFQSFRLEQAVRRRPFVFGSAIIAAVFLLIYYAVPVFAYASAHLLPSHFFDPLGQGVINSLDLEPSQLTEEEQQSISAQFQALNFAAGNPSPHPLRFATSYSMGANAFVVPGGRVVLLDDLTEILEDDEIAAVLAHELVHARERHAERNLIEAAGYGGIFAMIIGDFSTLTEVLASFTSATLLFSHSRDHESEADIEGALLLQEINEDPSAMVRLLSQFRRLEANHGREYPDHTEAENSFGDWLSTHPETDARIRQLEEALDERLYGN